MYINEINCQDLISKLLVLDATKRLTAAEALQHPWVKGNAAHQSHMEGAQSKLKQFNARRKLKVCRMLIVSDVHFYRLSPIQCGCSQLKYNPVHKYLVLNLNLNYVTLTIVMLSFSRD